MTALLKVDDDGHSVHVAVSGQHRRVDEQGCSVVVRSVRAMNVPKNVKARMNARYGFAQFQITRGIG